MSPTLTVEAPAHRPLAEGIDISQKLWSQYMAAIAASLGSGSTQASIQVLPQVVKLPQARQSKSELNNALDLFFSMIPQWGSSYAPSNQYVPYAYQTVLQQINPAPDVSADLQQRYQAQIRAAQAAADEASDYYTAKAVGYGTEFQQLYTAGLPPQAIPTWEQYWMAYQRVYDTMTANAAKLTQEALDLVKAEGSSDVIQALAKLNDWMKDHTSNPVPPWDFVTDPWTTLNNWTQGQSLAPSATSLSTSSKTYDYSQSVWSETTSKSVFFGLWRKSSTTHGSTESSLTTGSDYDLKVSYASTALLSALPSPIWYNGTVLVSYKDGPWVKGSNFDTKLAHPWGNGGVFPLQVTSAWVVFNPTLSIRLDQNSYRNFKSAYNTDGGGGFNFGPFYKDPNSRSQSDTSIKTDFEDSSSTVTIADTSNVPQIVAVTNQIMPG